MQVSARHLTFPAGAESTAVQFVFALAPFCDSCHLSGLSTTTKPLVRFLNANTQAVVSTIAKIVVASCLVDSDWAVMYQSVRRFSITGSLSLAVISLVRFSTFSCFSLSRLFLNQFLLILICWYVMAHSSLLRSFCTSVVSL